MTCVVFLLVTRLYEKTMRIITSQILEAFNSERGC
jgi:hypothetical protein